MYSGSFLSVLFLKKPTDKRLNKIWEKGFRMFKKHIQFNCNLLVHQIVFTYIYLLVFATKLETWKPIHKSYKIVPN